MEKFYVYCLVNKILNSEEYDDFVKMIKSEQNEEIIFIARANMSNKILIGVKNKNSQILKDNQQDKYVFVPRKYFKAYVNVESLTDVEINEVQDFIKFKYSPAFTVVKNKKIYFNVKDRFVFEELINKKDEVVSLDNKQKEVDCKFYITPIYRQKQNGDKQRKLSIIRPKKHFVNPVFYDVIVKSKSKNQNITIDKVVESLQFQDIISISKISVFDYEFNTFYKIRTTDSDVFNKQSTKFTVDVNNNKITFFVDRIQKIEKYTNRQNNRQYRYQKFKV